MNAICLVVDRLHAGHLGAYGNSWIDTPALDRLAGQAFTFDHALIDSPHLETIYRSYWQGWHALCPDRPAEERPSLPAVLRQAGVHTTLLTDERLVARHPVAVDFDELLEIDPPWEPQGAQQIEQTHLAKCVVQIIDWLQSGRRPFLLWCHLAGLGTAWDAPLRFRQAYREQGDPQPTASAEVPEFSLPEDPDPDDLLPVAQAYAGQVSLLDTCLGALLELLEGPAAAETLLVLTSSRGFPLGEHRRVGPGDEDLYGELVQVPLMLRFPDRLGATARSQALVEPADLWATLLDCYGAAADVDLPIPSAATLMPIVRQQTDAIRDRLCLSGNRHHRAIRTPAWYLRTAAQPELFTKPDDRWEVNNVAVRCPEVVQCLLDVLDQYEQTLCSGPVSALPPLSEVLLTGLQ